MNRLIVGMVLLVGVAAGAHADSCFIAEGKVFRDAQTIRKLASNMNWTVGKSASIVAGNFIKGKKAIYPQDKLEICLKDTGADSLMFKVQSSSTDAGDASWTTLPSQQE